MLWWSSIYTWSRHSIVSTYVISCVIMWYHVFYVISCGIMYYHVISCGIIHVVPCGIMWYRVVSIMCYHVVSCDITWYHVIWLNLILQEKRIYRCCIFSSFFTTAQYTQQRSTNATSSAELNRKTSIVTRPLNVPKSNSVRPKDNRKLVSVAKLPFLS